jgi:elongation factor Ts
MATWSKAEELLRVKLGTKAGKAASRVTAEGVVASLHRRQHRRPGGSQLRNRLRDQERQFLAFWPTRANWWPKNNPADVAAGRLAPVEQDGFGPTVEDVRKGLIGKIGENMSFPPLQALQRWWPAGQPTCTAPALA